MSFFVFSNESSTSEKPHLSNTHVALKDLRQYSSDRSNSIVPLKAFVHIPKASGTTLVSIIEQEYRSDAIFRFRQSHPIDEQVKVINQGSSASMSYKIVTGHIGYGLHTLLNQPVFYFTMLREPISLIISRYYYRRQHRHQDHPLVLHANRSSLMEFAQAIEDNTMTRFLSGAEFMAQQSLGPDQSSFRELQTARILDASFQGDSPCSPAMLEIAKKNLRNNICTFGLTERFDESILLFSHVFGWERIYYLKQNIGKSVDKDSVISPEALALLKERNQYDMALYQYARQLFDQRIEALGANFQMELEKFQLVNPIYGRLNFWKQRIHQYPREAINYLRNLL